MLRAHTRTATAEQLTANTTARLVSGNTRHDAIISAFSISPASPYLSLQG
jgi:hypothetical protein